MIRFAEEPEPEFDSSGDYMRRWNEGKPGFISNAASYLLARCVRLAQRTRRALQELWAAR